MERGPEEHLSIGDYLAPLIHRKWLVIAITVLATAAAYAYYERQEKVYRTSTKLYVAQEGNPLIGTGAGYSDDRSVENQATLLTSQDVARAVAKRISFKGSPSELAGRVTATPSGGADFITITGRGTTGPEAAAIANGFAAAFIDVRSADRREQIDKALESYRKQLEQLPRGSSTAAERTEIASNIRQLEVARSSAPGNASQIDPAEAPSSPVGREPWKKALFAGFAALIGAMLLAYLLHRLDPRLRSVDEAAAVYKRPVVGSVPHDEDIDAFDDGRPVLSSASKEAFRELRLNLDLSALDRQHFTILVTSAGPGAGKSTVSRNLALAYHEAGRRVALVDADLRKPTLPALLGVNVEGGLTEVLAGERALDQAVNAINAGSSGLGVLGGVSHHEANGGNGPTPSSGEDIHLLPAGAQPPNPPAVLESAAMANLLRAVADSHDVAIIDSAPLTAVSDSIPLLSRVDAVIVVARSGVTDRRSAQRAADIINRVPGANLVGVVVNDLSGPEAGAYGANYGYGYGYGDAPKKTPASTSV